MSREWINILKKILISKVKKKKRNAREEYEFFKRKFRAKKNRNERSINYTL